MTQKPIEIQQLESIVRDCYKIILYLVDEKEADTEINGYLTPNQLLGHIHYYFKR